jgi:hypothetical protein
MVAGVIFWMLRISFIMLRHDFFHVVMLQSRSRCLMFAGVIFWMLQMLLLNVANFLRHVACNMVWCCDGIFFYFSFLTLQWRIWHPQLIWRLCARPEARVPLDVRALAMPYFYCKLSIPGLQETLCFLHSYMQVSCGWVITMQELVFPHSCRKGPWSKVYVVFRPAQR